MGESELERVPKNFYPFIVGIIYKDPLYEGEPRLYCGGSLIGLNLVLTAGHCVRDVLAKDLKVVVNTVDLEDGTEHDVDSWITYLDWTKENGVDPKYGENNIAIIKLKNPVDRSIQMGQLLVGATYLVRGTSAILTGWSLDTEYEFPRYLRKAPATILTTRAQKKFEKETHLKLNTQDNFYWTRASPCTILGYGDGGNPLLKQVNNKYRIAAIAVGVGPKDMDINDMNLLNVYLAIDPYITFIKDVKSQYSSVNA